MDIEIIDDVNTTLEKLLKYEFPETLPFDLSFAMPDKDFGPISGERPTVNFYLYDIKENVELRSNEQILERRDNGTIVRKQPPGRIKLSYLITAWSSAEDTNKAGTRTREEHKFLSKILWALIKYPRIPDSFLAGSLIGQEPPLPAAVVLPNGLQNPAEFWSTFEGRPIRPALEYNITFSLDYHHDIEGRMVASKISEYGNITTTYALAIRPGLQFDHPKGTIIKKARIEKTPVVTLASSTEAGAEKIDVSTTEGLSKDDFMIIIDGRKTEFCQLGEIPNEGVQIPITGILLFDHEKDTELKRVNPSPTEIDVKLATSAFVKSSALRIVGRDASKLIMGEVLKLEDTGKSEYLQITQVTGPEVGLGNFESLAQFGGMVTNNASSPVPIMGARIILLDTHGNRVAETISNSEGRYIFKKFGIGKAKYTIKVEAEGYNSVERTIDKIASAKIEDFIIKLGSE